MVGSMVGRTNARCEARFRTAHYRKCTCHPRLKKQRARLASCPWWEIQSKPPLTSAVLPEQEQVSGLALVLPQAGELGLATKVRLDVTSYTAAEVPAQRYRATVAGTSNH